MKIGFIGLGIMGAPMALHLIKAGHQLYYVKRGKPHPDIAASNAIACANSKEVAQQADIVILMVPDTPDVEAVLFGADGVAEGLSAGKTVIDMSSISPIETKVFAGRIKALGCDYLDAPVSGGEVGAKAASLTSASSARAAASGTSPIPTTTSKSMPRSSSAAAITPANMPRRTSGCRAPVCRHCVSRSRSRASAS